MHKKLFFIAGEASGDLQGALLIRALKKINPDLECRGLGGDLMRAEGMTIVHDLTKEAVLGLGDVLRKYFYFKQIFKEALSEVEQFKPDAIILIDYPGFNLRFASRIDKRFPVIYYVSPQVWAWGEWRIPKMRQTIDHMIVFFDFEEKLFQKEKIPATWVGHPLAQSVKASASKENLRKEFASTTPGNIVALLPGSRETEIRRILPEMLQTALCIKKQLPDTQFLISESGTLPAELYDKTIEETGISLPVKRIRSRSYDVLQASDFALVSSGTATLETALLEIPFVILYKTAFSTFFLGRRFIKIPYIGLVNVIATRKIVPEFIQHEIDPEKIAEEAVHLLQNQELRSRMIADLKAVKEKLGPAGAPERAAQAVLTFLSAHKK